MKNSRNKIFAAVVCGVIAGSVGTSILGKFETTSQVASNNSVADSSSDSTDNSTNNNYSDKEIQGEYWTGNSGSSGGRHEKGSHHKGAASVESTEGVDVASGSYTDGTYEGTAAGFSEGLTVSVEISNGLISDIQIVSNNETPGFCEKAFDTVPAEIIQSQSTDVDTVSGATYSSIGIINAVNSALSQAQQ